MNSSTVYLNGCQMWSFVPSLTSKLSPPWKAAVDKKIAELQAKSADRYNLHSKSLLELEVGDNVRLQDPISKRWKEEGIVLYKGEHRDYIMELYMGKEGGATGSFCAAMMRFPGRLKMNKRK